MSELSGSRVLITGGASGLGRRMALEMARKGARIVIWDLDRARMEQVADELLQVGGQKAHTYVCDISNRLAVYDAARRVKDEVGEIDILVNNAGVVSGKSFLELSDDKIEKTFGVNSLSLFWTAKAFLPGMMQRGRGHVVTIASAAGWVGVNRLADYCASKWAAVGFDESLRMELRETAPGVQTTVICPFFIDTGMFSGVQTRFSWLLPILKEEDVAKRVVRAVERNEARVMLPPVLALVPVGRFLPPRVFDRAAGFLGVNAAMHEFKGRAVDSSSVDVPTGQSTGGR
jgi:all-trans-retinol dehydrogenase (NAD+)